MTFNAGEQLRYITVDLIDDSTFEGTENLFLNITSASNVSITDSQGGTIIDDDPEPLPIVSISDASANEAKLNTKGKNAGRHASVHEHDVHRLSVGGCESDRDSRIMRR